jgi:hypothetical protein
VRYTSRVTYLFHPHWPQWAWWKNDPHIFCTAATLGGGRGVLRALAVGDDSGFIPILAEITVNDPQTCRLPNRDSDEPHAAGGGGSGEDGVGVGMGNAYGPSEENLRTLGFLCAAAWPE